MSIDPREFRNALGCFATGITVVTSQDADGNPVGVTANSFNSVSLEPPLVLFSLAHASQSLAALKHHRHFVVHVLGEGQQDLSNRFARSSGDKWSGLAYTTTECGCPLLSGTLATFVCTIAHIYDGGDHEIIVGEVQHFAVDPAQQNPLLYVRGMYRKLEGTQTEAYYHPFSQDDWLPAARALPGSPSAPQEAPQMSTEAAHSPVSTVAPTPDELYARAEALLPALRERSNAANAARKLPVSTIEDMRQAGFFRILQPAHYGGYEMDPQVFFKVQIAIATACPSTAWALCVIAVHAWQMALFDPQAQEDVWGEDTNTLISSSYMPVGKVEHVDGGYKLSGRWGFSSGSDHCDWAFLGAFVPPSKPGGRPDMRTFLVPKRDYTLEDTWNVAGLRATGSNDVVVEDAFVPEHRTHRFSDGFMLKSPGHAVNSAPLYKLPFGQLFVRSVSTPAIGMAKGALDAFCEVSRSRISRADGQKAIEDQLGQAIGAEAASVIDEVEAVLFRNFDLLMQAARTEEPLSMERRVRFRYDSSRAAERCVEAVDKMFTASGSRAIFLDHPMQRFFQDIHACRAHYANNPDKPGRNMGRVLFGHKTQDYFI